ncbi:peroxidase family protein [Salipiger sp. H15]|uniref:Peroxidase family protein n=1 Tax=Alloyangia sp. H15 TaxID=3029062 RepID=A0AAU8ADC7_9RHOB
MSDGGDGGLSAGRVKWAETYRGGSPEAERAEFLKLADLMLDAQLKSRKAGKARRVDRAFHAKSIAAFSGGTLTFSQALPEDLRVGFARPGASYPASVRFSNAASFAKSDEEKDLRGLALRIAVSETEHHDLLATNWPVPHARDAHQFVHFAHAVSGGGLSRAAGLAGLCRTLGVSEVRRMLGNVREALRPCDSVALESYWSRGAIRWGDEAVRYAFKPARGTPGAFPAHGAGRLSAEFAQRIAAGDVTFELYLQRFVTESLTPIEDAAQDWTERDSPPILAATLTLPRRDLTAPDAIAEQRALDDGGFNPWNTTEEFRPLGHLNRARKAVYDASLHHRSAMRWRSERPPLQNRMFGGGTRWLLRKLNTRVPWHRMRLRTSLLNLDALRYDLRAQNLVDTEPREAPPSARALPVAPLPEERAFRTYDGRANDLSDPRMGAVGATFGRNMPLETIPPDEPNAVTVCRELMDRKAFIPARTLNILAAAWIQFQVHDWVAHQRRKLGEQDLVVPIPGKYPDWASRPGDTPGREMRISGNVPHPSSDWVFTNTTSHWWDGSEVYGADPERARSLRDGPRIRLNEKGYLPEDVNGMSMTGFNESWWMGLSVMHTLFAREHNVLVGELGRAYPHWDDERLYQTARLIVSALIAKIHTVEWTPAILGTEALDIGMKTNWYGPPSGDWLTKLGIWLTDVHALKGIPRTMPDHHAAPYSLTEEFATVYRMHPLIPDDYIFYDYGTGKQRLRRGFLDIQGAQADDEMRAIGLRDALYSFGTAHPGAITLHNFPRSLQHFEREGEVIDLSVVDIMRTRVRKVPRYNGFRRGLHMPEIKSWDDLTPDPETNRLCREIYGQLDHVDTVVGLLGEAPPTGFGFSDTAFRIFILMASRRLQSDRFLTVDFRPEIYSPLGMDWIERNSMTSVILRHCPELGPVLPRDATAFAPWRTV